MLVRGVSQSELDGNCFEPQLLSTSQLSTSAVISLSVMLHTLHQCFPTPSWGPSDTGNGDNLAFLAMVAHGACHSRLHRQAHSAASQGIRRSLVLKPAALQASTSTNGGAHSVRRCPRALLPGMRETKSRPRARRTLPLGTVKT